MTTTAAPLTADDVAALAELVRPALRVIAQAVPAGVELSPADALRAAVLYARQQNDDRAARLAKAPAITRLMAATYDEFRAEVA